MSCCYCVEPNKYKYENLILLIQKYYSNLLDILSGELLLKDAKIEYLSCLISKACHLEVNFL